MADSNNDPVLSRLELVLLAFHDGMVRDPHPDDIAEARRSLQERGLLHYPMDGDDLDDDLPLTKRGEVHLDHLLDQALPQRRWSNGDR